MRYGLVAQLVRAPPCHGGGRGFEPHPGRLQRIFPQWIIIWDLSSAGRASALQAEGHRFEPYRSHESILYWLCWCGGIGRRKGLKIPREQSRAGSSPATSSIAWRIPDSLLLFGVLLFSADLIHVINFHCSIILLVRIWARIRKNSTARKCR